MTEFSIPLVSALQWWKEIAEQEKESRPAVFERLAYHSDIPTARPKPGGAGLAI